MQAFINMAASQFGIDPSVAQGLAGAVEDGGARGRRFLADYEAKSLFQAIEALVAEGQHERAIRA